MTTPPPIPEVAPKRRKRTVLTVVLVVGALLMGTVALLYLHDVWTGIVKHSPPCAPITSGTTLIVFLFTGLGTALSGLILFGARRRQRWIPAALLAVLLNATELCIWAYWIGSKTLLPYDEWCTKVGMP